MHGAPSSRLTYAQLVRAVQHHRIKSVVFEPAKHEIDATSVNGASSVAGYPSDRVVTAFQRLLRRDHVPFDSRSAGSRSSSTVWALLPFVLLAAFWAFIIRYRRNRPTVLPGA
jgi:ATP-dependent Zn protease